MSEPCKWCYPRKNMYSFERTHYEKSDKHETLDCPQFKAALKRNELSAIKFNNKMTTGRRVCGYCGGTSHNSTNCEKRFNDARASLLKQKDKADKVFEWLHKIGFGPGCAINTLARETSYRPKSKEYKVVAIEEFQKHYGPWFFKELLHGATRRWYYVCGMDTCGETIKQIHLPYHPEFSPCYGSLKTEIINKADPKEIDKLKKYVKCYDNPVLNYSDAESFFKDGYKFVSGTSFQIQKK